MRPALVERAYGWIRAWCEVVVEQELLGGVTQRYQPHVRMTSLANIKVGKLAATSPSCFPGSRRLAGRRSALAALGDVRRPAKARGPPL